MKDNYDKGFYENRKIEKGITKDSFEMKYLAKTIIKSLNIPMNGSFRILDLGCDDGYILNRICNYNNDLELFGIDLSENAVIIAKRINNKNDINFMIGNAAKLEFPNEFFDFIICSEIIEHIVNYKRTIAEIERVLKVGGKCFITIPNNLNKSHPFYNLRHKIDLQEGHIKLFEIEEMESYFKKSKLENYEYSGHIISWLLDTILYSKHREKLLNFFFIHNTDINNGKNQIIKYSYIQPKGFGKFINYLIGLRKPLERILFKNNSNCLGAFLVFKKVKI